jgi:hypothetical protein
MALLAAVAATNAQSAAAAKLNAAVTETLEHEKTAKAQLQSQIKALSAASTNEETEYEDQNPHATVNAILRNNQHKQEFRPVWLECKEGTLTEVEDALCKEHDINSADPDVNQQFL